MERILKKIEVKRQVGASGVALSPGEYTIGKDLSKADAVALIRMGKAVPVAEAAAIEHRDPAVEHRDPPEMSVREPEPEPEPERPKRKRAKKKRAGKKVKQ